MSPNSKEAKAHQVSIDKEAKVKKNAPTAVKKAKTGDNGEYKSPLACLFSSSDEEDVKSVRIEDELAVQVCCCRVTQ